MNTLGAMISKSRELQQSSQNSDCSPHPSQVASESQEWRSVGIRADVGVYREEVKAKSSSGESGKDLESLGREEKLGVEAQSEPDGSFLHAVVNMVGMLIGLGQLSTPYALENGGWASVFLLVGLGAACAYSSHLLGKCLHNDPKSRDYKDIGHHAFGSKGRIIATTFIYMEIFMALVSYTISLHDNLAIVFMGVDLRWAHLTTSQLLATIAVLVALPSLWLRDLSSISFLSTAGILMSLLIFVTVAGTAIFGGVRANHDIPPLQLHNIPAISGLYIFSFAGHIVFPNLYTAMKDPSKFTQVFIGIYCQLFNGDNSVHKLSIHGAKLFGPQVNSQITLSMPRNLIVTKIALWATVLTPMTKYALEFAPFAIQLEQTLPHLMKPRTRTIIRGTVGSILLLLILVLALTVPYFEHVLSLTGSLVSVGICIIFPCAFYTKIFWREIRRPLLVLNLILIAVGVLMGAFGTISSSKSLLQSLWKSHSN
ncbi:UNVERIFIED_CONTAM: Amino acid transporter AVT1H [Sesamum calycinum]|uniref:Amino acid transporter AVT1H n=1 Tax=Sesamum calycinum TaxID=2727403 RepID=A0AAW2QL69_9LAMI